MAFAQKQSMLVVVSQFEECRIIATIGNEIHDAACREGTDVQELPGWHQDDPMPCGGPGFYVWQGDLNVSAVCIDDYDWDGEWRKATVHDLDDFCIERLQD